MAYAFSCARLKNKLRPRSERRTRRSLQPGKRTNAHHTHAQICFMSHTQGAAGWVVMAGVDAYAAIAELLHKSQVRNYTSLGSLVLLTLDRRSSG